MGGHGPGVSKAWAKGSEWSWRWCNRGPFPFPRFGPWPPSLESLRSEATGTSNAGGTKSRRSQVPEWVTGQGWDGYSAGRSSRQSEGPEVLSARTIGGSAVPMPMPVLTPIANANHEMDVDTDNNKRSSWQRGPSGPTSTRTGRLGTKGWHGWRFVPARQRLSTIRIWGGEV